MKIQNNVVSKFHKYSVKDGDPKELDGQDIKYTIYSFEDDGLPIAIYLNEFGGFTDYATMGWKFTDEDGKNYGNFKKIHENPVSQKTIENIIEIFKDEYINFLKELKK